ncbi:MAG: LTA synthase family protein [Muribaculaceae bacterium]|nr:LTA synthase family protein [Muribaculaceae bacterium]
MVGYGNILGSWFANPRGLRLKGPGSGFTNPRGLGKLRDGKNRDGKNNVGWAVGLTVGFLFVVIMAMVLLTGISGSDIFRLASSALGDALLLTIPMVWLRGHGRWLMVALLLTTTIFVTTNIIYYDFFSHLISMRAFGWLGNLDLMVIEAAIGPISWKIITFVLIIAIITLTACYIVGRKYSRLKISRKFAIRFSAVGIAVWTISQIVMTIHYSDTYPDGRGIATVADKISGRHLNRDLYFLNNGLLIHFVHSLGDVDPSRNLTSQERSQIDTFIANNTKVETLPGDTIANRMNFLLIVIESFENFPLSYSPDGKPVMPTLDSLSHLPSTHYWPRIVSQVGMGNSSDGQLTILTGLLPMLDYSAAMEFPQNKYPSLFHALRGLRGYNTFEVICEEPQMWNQDKTGRSYGFDEMKTIKDIDPKGEARWSQRDLYWVNYLIKYLPTVSQPWAGMAVTLSLHAPYLGTKGASKRFDKLNINEELKNYLKMCNFDDTYLSRLFAAMKKAEIYDNTIIAITGDHSAKGLSERVRPESLRGKERYLPLIILNAPCRGSIHPGVAGQIDIYPTLRGLLQLSDYPWPGLGRDLLSNPPGGATRIDGTTVGEIAEKEKKREEEAWEMSRLIISGNYFSGNENF